MVVQWLLHLAGCLPVAVPTGIGGAEYFDDRMLSLAEAAELAECSTSTVKRRRRGGRLPNARHDEIRGCIVVPVSDLAAAGLLGGPATGQGYSRGYAKELLLALRKVIVHAKTQHWITHEATEGLRALTPDAAVARTKPATVRPRPLSLPECRQVAEHLHVVHQLVLWMQRLLGLRISEAYGPHVGDVVEFGDQGLLMVGRQGGKSFLVRDEHGRAVTVQEKAEMKTATSHRVRQLCQGPPAAEVFLTLPQRSPGELPKSSAALGGGLRLCSTRAGALV
jgi:hypothetical protein